MELDRSQLLQMYRRMWEIRLFEDEVWKLCQKNEVTGTTHLYQGQEAIAVGVCAALRADDYITYTYRSHGHVLAKGAGMKETMAELLGRSTGLCRGKGGSMHLTDFAHGALGAFAVVGAGLPVAVGAALSAQMRQSGQVAVAYFGDGAANIGAFHESLNMAASWRLPVVFVCENNLYGEYTPQAKTTPVVNLADRAAAYDMPGVVVDGNDVLAVYHTAIEAVDRARRGSGPSLLECKTYRQGGHSRNDPGNYRPKEEVEAWKRRDPLLLCRQHLLEAGLLNEAEDQRLQVEIGVAVQEATRFALQSPYPELDDAYTEVYASQEKGEIEDE